MDPVKIIARKRDGLELTRDEIQSFVTGVTRNSWPDYQIAALLMAIRLAGMTSRETVDLTMAMAASGDLLDLSQITGVKVDKHSTGGVGDTTTLILAPLVAACGAKVAKMSGRGLGHTGGTLDKLESIPGFSVSLTREAFIRQVNDISVAVIGQTADLAPADKVLYALRDVTATVDSLPLIVSSILSKKIAAGCDAVVLDVKTGSGAIIPTLEGSIELARTMVEIGCKTGRRFSALVTDMDQPLGNYIGNALEFEEAVRVLRGEVTGPLRDVSMELGAQMLLSAGIASDAEDGKNRLESALASGQGLEKLRAMIAAQSGDPRVVDDLSLLPQAPGRESVRAARSGYLCGMRTGDIGNAARLLGAGRIHKEDAIDPSVGLIMRARIGDYVEAGQELCVLHTSPASDVAGARALLDGAFSFSDTAADPPKLIHAIIEAER
ncbi:MAG: thymidine phosphorylase [Clostridia bacterium]|nr:thymidine phosphorylase [Clostridia bacterium]